MPTLLHLKEDYSLHKSPIFLDAQPITNFEIESYFISHSLLLLAAKRNTPNRLIHSTDNQHNEMYLVQYIADTNNNHKYQNPPKSYHLTSSNQLTQNHHLKKMIL